MGNKFEHQYQELGTENQELSIVKTTEPIFNLSENVLNLDFEKVTKSLGQLVPVSSIHYCTSTSGLSTS